VKVNVIGWEGAWGQSRQVKEGLLLLGHALVDEGPCDFIYCMDKPSLPKAIEEARKWQSKLIVSILDLPIKEGTECEQSPSVTYEYRDQVLNNADRVYAISEFTKQQIKRYWDFDDVTVVPVPSQFKLASPSPMAQRQNRVVCIGRLADPLKRAPLVLQALELMDEPPECMFIDCQGRAKFKSDKVQVTNCGFVPKYELRGILRTSRAILCPSVFEGLGLPPIDALTVGTPAIISDIPVKREVFGETSVLFHEPDNAESLAACVQQLLNEPGLTTRIVKSARAVVKEYQPDAVALKILENL